jgi:hypothetical protein
MVYVPRILSQALRPTMSGCILHRKFSIFFGCWGFMEADKPLQLRYSIPSFAALSFVVALCRKISQLQEVIEPKGVLI